MSKAFIILCVMFLAGCSGVRMTKLKISSEFSDGQQELIIAAADAWCAADARLCVPVVVTDRPGAGNCIVIGWPKKVERGQADGRTELNYTRAPKVYIPGDMLDDPYFYQIVLHELGHALSGTVTHLGPGHVMHFKIEATEQELTVDDVALAAAR